jgi:hypothetical protein
MMCMVEPWLGDIFLPLDGSRNVLFQNMAADRCSGRAEKKPKKDFPRVLLQWREITPAL